MKKIATTLLLLLLRAMMLPAGTLASDHQVPPQQPPPPPPNNEAATNSNAAPPPPPNTKKEWIRGVNIGGWLVLERFITPYLFAITDCHLKGDLCWYPGQLSAPTNDQGQQNQLCDFHCKPHLQPNPDNKNKQDYPWDAWTLMEAFSKNQKAGIQWLNHHYDTFVTRDDVMKLKEAGVTHVRVPLPHWILQERSYTYYKDRKHKAVEEPWFLSPSLWLHFIRFVGWCRQAGIEVWPDLHTAPGSQNGFDNSGRLNLKEGPTCKGWASSEENINRTLLTVKTIVQRIVDDGLSDVVTGFGILNEPFMDCPMDIVKDYSNRALKIVWDIMGKEKTHVYMGDLFNSTKWNDGTWWVDSEYKNTYLDSHYYHVFADQPRALSPRQHIAYVCQKNAHDTIGCCYEEGGKKEGESDPEKAKSLAAGKTPVRGIKRMIGEWSAAYDTLVVSLLDDVVMAGIRKSMEMPMYNRQLSEKERAFLKNFVQAQMVTYEASHIGVSSAWFYWTLKMEGGPFAEWDFLRGVKEGWIPKIPTDRTKTSRELYGSCADIMFRTDDSMDIIHPFPDPKTLDPDNWQGFNIDDDIVLNPENLRAQPGRTTVEGAAWSGQTGGGEVPANPDTTKDPHTDPGTPSESSETTKPASPGNNTNPVPPTPPRNPNLDESKGNIPPPPRDSHFDPYATTQGGRHHHGGGGGRRHHGLFLPLVVLAFFIYAVKRVFFASSPFRSLPCDRPSRSGYSVINGGSLSV